jgi:hypothetical protein
MAKKFIPELESAFESFKAHLENNFDARITDEAGLRRIFLGELDGLVSAALENDIESGCCLDEMYGDGIFSCIEVPDEDDEEDECLGEEDCA